MKTLLTIMTTLVGLSVNVFADNLRLYEPQYGGTGCPAGSASVALSPDDKALSILFDQYVVEAGGSLSFDRKNCNIAIPLRVPQGYSFAIIDIDYRGFTGLPAGGRAQLSVDYFIAGAGRGVRSSKTFYGPVSGDYLKSDHLGLSSVVWSACGAETILRTNTTLLVQSNSQREQAMATVDSMDVQSGLVYHFAWKRCN